VILLPPSHAENVVDTAGDAEGSSEIPNALATDSTRALSMFSWRAMEERRRK
jgi:hypothetical protein